jgi:hypothetical protein
MPLPHISVRLAPLALVGVVLTACASDPVEIQGSVFGPAVAVATGVVQDSAGRPVAGVDVYAGVLRGGVDCTQITGGLRSLARTTTDAAGRYRMVVPGDSAMPASPPLCIGVLAELRDRSALVGEPSQAQSMPTLAAIPASPTAEVGGTLQLQRFTFDSRREPDDTWARLAGTTVPGFAGVILDGSTWVVFVTDPATQGAAAQRYVASTYCAGCTPAVRRADYDFAALRRYYDRAQILTSLDGWSFTDLDEARNRLVLGYENAEALRRAQRALPMVDVPPGAILFEIRGPVVAADR